MWCFIVQQSSKIIRDCFKGLERKCNITRVNLDDVFIERKKDLDNLEVHSEYARWTRTDLLDSAKPTPKDQTSFLQKLGKKEEVAERDKNAREFAKKLEVDKKNSYLEAYCKQLRVKTSNTWRKNIANTYNKKEIKSKFD